MNRPMYTYGRSPHSAYHTFLSVRLMPPGHPSTACPPIVKCRCSEQAPRRLHDITVPPDRVHKPINYQQVGERPDNRRYRRIAPIRSQQEQDRGTHEHRIDPEYRQGKRGMHVTQHRAARRRREEEDQIAVEDEFQVRHRTTQDPLDEVPLVLCDPVFERKVCGGLLPPQKKLSRLLPLLFKLYHIREGPPVLS